MLWLVLRSTINFWSRDNIPSSFLISTHISKISLKPGFEAKQLILATCSTLSYIILPKHCLASASCRLNIQKKFHFAVSTIITPVIFAISTHCALRYCSSISKSISRFLTLSAARIIHCCAPSNLATQSCNKKVSWTGPAFLGGWLSQTRLHKALEGTV